MRQRATASCPCVAHDSLTAASFGRPPFSRKTRESDEARQRGLALLGGANR